MTQALPGLDADAVVRAVQSCPSVDGLDAGPTGSAATFLVGRRIAGVSVGDARLTVQVRMRWGAAAADVLREVRAVLAPLAGARTIEVVVADIALPPGFAIEQDVPDDTVPATPTDEVVEWAAPTTQPASPAPGAPTTRPAGVASSSALTTPIAGETPPPS